MATIEQVLFPAQAPKRKRVAAYARVSTGKDAMLHSLSVQISSYSKMIQSRKDWQYVGVYADEAKTGTKDTRENFQRLLQDCRAGKIDMVITKSISRFARNTVTLLEVVRELKALGVDIFFEEQNLHTLSSDGELMITILAGYAEEESRSVSENMKWRIRKNFEAGIPWDATVMGYRLKDGGYIIEPHEAEIVRRIYREYLSGKGVVSITNDLNADGLKTRFNNDWHICTVGRILRNITYTGNLLLQKTYRADHISKKDLVNHGERPKYSVTDTHEAIISMENFNRVQAEIRRRAEEFHTVNSPMCSYPFAKLITCGKCGRPYRRKVTHTGPVWICTTYNSKGKAYCASKAIPENTLIAMTEEVTGDLNAIRSEITAIQVQDNNTLVYTLTDGSKTVKQWKDRSRAESWTAEMRKSASDRTRAQRAKEVR